MKIEHVHRLLLPHDTLLLLTLAVVLIPVWTNLLRRLFERRR